MAKVKGINALERRINRVIAGALASSRELEEVTGIIKQTLREGQLMNLQNIKGLRPSTVERRKELEQVNFTHPQYQAPKSNLTFTGDFIESIKGKARVARGRLTLTFAPSGVHKGYNYLNKKGKGKRGKGTTNQKIAEGQKKMGRDISAVGPAFINIVRQLFRSAINRAIKTD